MKKNILLVVLLVFFSGLVFSAYVKVKSPNGGEPWELGSSQLIEWDKSGDFTKFHIILRKGNHKVGAIAQNLGPSTTSFLWEKVGEYIGGNAVAGDDYKIRIKAVLAEGSKIGDDSDGYFSIKTNPTKFAQVSQVKLAKMFYDISPTGGNYVTGQDLQISWKTNWKVGSRDTFFLALYSDSGKRYKRSMGTTSPGSKSFSWLIPGDIWPEFYTIKISYQEYGLISHVGSQKQVSGLTGIFHIARAYEAKPKMYIIKGGNINNGWSYYQKGDHSLVSCKNIYFEYSYVKKGVMRVGWLKHDGLDDRYCWYTFRSFVYFTLDHIPRGGILLKAELKYDKFVHPGELPGDSCPSPKIYVLHQPLTNFSALSSSNSTCYSETEDFRPAVIKWLGIGNSNHGIILRMEGDKSWTGKIPRGGLKCNRYYENPRLILTIKEKVK